MTRIFLILLGLSLSGCTFVTGLTEGAFSSSSAGLSSSSGSVQLPPQRAAGGFGSSSSSGSGGGPVTPVTYQALWDSYSDPSGAYTGRDLTRITLRELEAQPDALFAVEPVDYRQWCPAFKQLDREGRKAFYLGLISGIARYESDFRANVKYLEPGGHYSRGLTQLGQLALSYYPRSRCDVSGDPRQLHNVDKNLTCATMLVSYWVQRDGYVASKGNNGSGDARYYGAARYWATLREGLRGHEQISAYTRSLPICGG